MAGSKYTEEVRTFIVNALACFDTPSVIVEAVKKEFGVVVSKQAVEAYDPTKRAGRSLSAKWRAVFTATREEFLKDTSQVGISHRAVRVRGLQRMADRAETMGNLPLAVQIYEQAAKEMGDAYSNRRRLEHSGPEGAPIKTESVSPISEKVLAALSPEAQEVLEAELERLASEPAAGGGGPS